MDELVTNGCFRMSAPTAKMVSWQPIIVSPPAGAKHCKNISFFNRMKRERGKHRKQRSKWGSLPENSGV
jgi:hypothetical protein